MANATIPGGGGGKIKSVGLTMPGEFSVANSPLTASGTLAVTKVNQSANLVYAGPTTGIAAQPTFRSIVAGDLPAGTGTVTSVALSLPSFITVSGSPVTTSGTLTGTLATQTANTVFAGPTSGGVVAPTFRALVTADLPAGVGTVTSVGLSTNASWLTAGSSPITTSGTITLNLTTGLTANSFLATPNGSTGAITLRAIAALDLTTALTTPPAIGGTTPAAGAFTTLGGTIITASTRFVGPIIAPASDSTTAIRFTKADGSTNVMVLDTTNNRATVQNASSTGSSLWLSANNGSASAFFGTYGTAFAVSRLINNVVLGGTNDVLIVADGDVSSGGTHSIFLHTGGYNTSPKVSVSSVGVTTIVPLDTATAAVTNALVVDHSSSGTPAAGYGTGVLIRGQSSTTASQSMTDIQASWVVATHASRTARVIHNVYDTAVREALRFEASGSAPMIGFLGAAAVVRQTDGNNLTNNVTSGGTTAQIDDFTSLTLYATDAAAIRNDIYQLARMLKICNDALRLYGLLT